MRTPRIGLIQWIKVKIVDPFFQIVRRGAEPKQLAFSAALGITLGVFPICGDVLSKDYHYSLYAFMLYWASVSLLSKVEIGDAAKAIQMKKHSSASFSHGVTVFLCGMAIALLGNVCHAPTLMLANFVATPIELSLVVPFLRFGEIVTGGPHFPLTTDALRKVLTGEASRDVLISIYHALLGWFIAAPVILAVLYVLFFPCFKYLIRKFSIPSAPSAPLYSLSEISAKARVV
ncbi:hypothetical protein EJ110_NYTH22612 [Nymphaea thermarum]|nr:hypothetical protein EJ110_NYTH22612 [Nymphaea thermarum]